MTTSVNPKAPMTQPTSTDQRSTIDKLAQQDAEHLALDQAHAAQDGRAFHDQVASTAVFYLGAAVAASDNPQQTLNALHVALGMTTVDDTTGLDLLTPTAVRPATGLGRRRPANALVRAGHQVIVAQIDCWDFCTEKHMDEPLAFEDIIHSSDAVELRINSATLPGTSPMHLLYASLRADPAASDERERIPHLTVSDDATAEEAVLDADMGDALADHMIQVAQDIRRLARTVREATA